MFYKHFLDQVSLTFLQLAARWRNLSEEEKKPYIDQEEADRQRFIRESAEADAKAIAIQEARRLALSMQDGEDHTSRGARRRVEQMREQKQQKQREPTWSAEALERRAQQQAETAARREERAKQEEELKKKHRKLDKEEAKKASQRLEYLLAQSSIFSKLQDGGKSKAVEKSKDAGKSRQRGAHHIHDKDSRASDEEEDEDDEASEENHVFLSQQPSCIKFGQLKPYQLESLNWMIHLSEKGLNGILADGEWIESMYEVYFVCDLLLRVTVHRDGSRENTAIDCYYGIPLRIQTLSRSSFNLCSKVNIVQLDEGNHSLVPRATSN